MVEKNRPEPTRGPAPEAFAPTVEAVPEQPEPLATPEEHARAMGLSAEVQEPFRVGGAAGTKVVAHWLHAAAAQLHGWNAHKLASAEPFKLTRAAYEQALEAARAPIERRVGDDGKPTGPRLTAEQVRALPAGTRLHSDYEPHKPALSPFAPKSEAAR